MISKTVRKRNVILKYFLRIFILGFLFVPVVINAQSSTFITNAFKNYVSAPSAPVLPSTNFIENAFEDYVSTPIVIPPQIIPVPPPITPPTESSTSILNAFKNYVRTPSPSLPLIKGETPKAEGVIQTTIITQAVKQVYPATAVADVATALRTLLTQEEFISQLRGPTGEQGPQGEAGPQGPAGRAGTGSTTIINPSPTNNGATAFNATNLSSNHVSTGTANITALTVVDSITNAGTLEVTGATTLGALTATTFNGSTITANSGTLYGTATDSVTSLQLLTTISDETGTGSLVFATSPTLVTPVLGVASATSLANPIFTTATGAMSFTPAAGSNLNVTLSTTGDFAVNTDQLYVDTSAGNVGIGTTEPTSNLTVSKSQDSFTDLGIRNVDSGENAGSRIVFTNDSGSGGQIHLNSSTYTGLGGANSLNLYNMSGPIGFSTSGIEKMRITTAGNVGIGTTEPSAKLSVDGSVYATGNLTLDGTTGVTLNGVGAGAVFAGTGNHDITASGGTLRVGASTIIGDVAALDGTIDIGTVGTPFGKIYADEVNASTLVGTLTGGNLIAETFTINSDNATADTENGYLSFERGSETPNALLGWDATAKEFDLNSGLHITNTIGAPYGLNVDTTANIAGALTALTYNGNTITTGTGTLTLGAGSTLATSATNSITLTSTGATNVTLPTSGTLYGTATDSVTSLQLLTTISDETGTGALVFADTPTLVTPVLGVATGTSLALGGATIGTHALAVTGTADISGAVTALTYNGNTITTGSSTYTGTAGQTYTFPTTSATIARTDAGNTFTGVNNFTSPTITTDIRPTSNDGASLGISGTAFSDLFLASGGVIDWLAGASTITHSANTLTIGGSGATTLALGTNSLTMTGSLGATGARVTKGWFTDIESTNMPTVGGTPIDSTFAPIAGTMYIGTTAHALNRASAAEGLAGITSLTPGANFTLSQNSVNVFTSEETGAIVDTLYLKAGNVGIGTTAPGSKLSVSGGGSFSGSVGIGTTAPQELLHVGAGGDAGATGETIAIITNTGRTDFAVRDSTNDIELHAEVGPTRALFGTFTNHEFTLRTNNTDRLTIDTSGNVGIGTTGPSRNLEVTKSGSPVFELGAYSTTDAERGVLIFKKSSSATIGTDAVTADGELLGEMGFQGVNSGSSKITGVGIKAEQDGAAGASFIPGRLLFQTATNAAAISTRMVITSAGNVGIGTTNPGAQLDLSTDDARKLTTTTWTTGSDSRFKTNIESITDSLDIIRRVNPVKFHYNSDFLAEHPSVVDTDYYNFIAQEYQEVFPNSVSENNDRLYVNSSNMIPYAIAGVKALDLNLSAIANTSTPVPGSDSETFVTAFFNNVYSKVGTWMADAGNGITNIFANKATLDQICLKDGGGTSCYDRNQIDTLLAGAGSSGSGGGSSEPTPDPTCTDGVQNQDETGVDVGGVCGGGEEPPGDPTCVDGIQNQDETGVDTGGVCGEETPASDISALTTAKATAQGLIDANAVESETSGDHIVGSLATLSSALAEATATDADTQEVIDAQVITLNDAISAYNSAIVP